MREVIAIGFDLYFTHENLKAGLLVSLLSVWVLVGVFYYLNRYTKRRYFSIWTVAWLFYALWLTLSLGLQTEPEQPLVLMVKQWCLGVSAIFLLWGAARFLGQRVSQRQIGLFLFFLLAWSYIGAYQVESRLQVHLPIFAFLGLTSLFTAWGFYHYRRKREYLAAGLLSFGFGLWGVYLVSFPFLQTSPGLYSTSFFIAAVLQLFIAVSMVVLVLEQVRFLHQRRSLNEVRRQKQEKTVIQSHLASSEERYRRLFELAGEPIILLNSANLGIIEMNRAAESLLGMDQEEARRQSFTAFLHTHVSQSGWPSDPGRWFDFICKQHPLLITRKDGSVTPTEVAGAPIDYEGHTAFQLFLRDITDRNELVEKLRHAEKLSAVGQMVSGVAHEVQNPLAATKSFLDLGLANPGLASQTRSDLEMALKECDRASRIMRNFLSLAREKSEDKSLISLNDLVEQVMELRRYDFAVNSVEKDLALAPDLPQIFVQADQIQQVLINLVNNAFQAIVATNQSGCIRISTEARDNHVVLSVEDNGPGVPSNLVKRLFEPFFTTKPVGIGTGLGLSIAYRIAWEHQGRLCYEASSMGGARFVLHLPLQSNPEKSVPQANPYLL